MQRKQKQWIKLATKRRQTDGTGTNRAYGPQISHSQSEEILIWFPEQHSVAAIWFAIGQQTLQGPGYRRCAN